MNEDLKDIEQYIRARTQYCVEEARADLRAAMARISAIANLSYLTVGDKASLAETKRNIAQSETDLERLQIEMGRR